MKKFLLICLLLPFGLMAQTTPTTTTDPAGNQVFTFIEQIPTYPGGEAAMQKFVAKNLKYTKEAKKANVHGLVIAQFVVDTTGAVTDVNIVKKLGYGLDDEATRVINSFPKFKPAIQDGKPVSFRFTLPFRF
ncbi:MAG: hypothetical protein COW65_04915 [Cytophagales bacterium CG18_big_fil_WC_8_21_14_2_50_42_9]|nr:MAG: hypothetical protein COW65_04915 [Cytophagales bacterium CG18_big_fil_WC_8_21_14_2_50_42_9]